MVMAASVTGRPSGQRRDAAVLTPLSGLAIQANLSTPWTRGPPDGTEVSAGVTRRDLLVPAGDVLRGARALADVARRRPDQAPGALLLQHVGRPAGGAGAGEHRREHRRRH